MSLDVHNSFFLVWSDGLVLGYIQRPSKTNGLKEDCQNGVLQGCRGCTLNSQHSGMRMIHMTYLMNILRLIAWNLLVRLTSFFFSLQAWRCDTFLSILESYVTMVETVLSMDKKVLVVVWCSAGVHRSVTFSCLLANVWLLCQLQSLKSSLFIMVPWGPANLRWFDIIWAQGWLGQPTLPAVCGHFGVSLADQNFLLTCNVQITDCHLIAEMWGFSMRHFKPV